MNAETNIGMDAPTMHNSLAPMPFRKTKVDALIDILCLPDKKRIIVHSNDGSFRVMDLESGTQIGEEWEDKDNRVWTIALSPDGKKVASGSLDGAVKLWNVDTGKVIKTWSGHTKQVNSVSWSSDGGRMVSGSEDGTFRVWGVQSGKNILGPINAGVDVRAVCYSPDAKMIATGGTWGGLKIWDANSGELLKTFEGVFSCLAWTSDGKTLIAGRSKIDTATWTEVDRDLCQDIVGAISLSPNDRILATKPLFGDRMQLWDLETNQPIGTPLQHQHHVWSATFSVDGKFLLTYCDDYHIYTWDVSAIVKRAGLPPDILDVTPRPAKIKGARIPPGFFDDALREANLRIRLSQSQSQSQSQSLPIPTPHQRTFNPFASVWRSSEPHAANESATQSRSRSFSWARNLSNILRRRDRLDIQLQEVEVPYTAGRPRNYHARKRKMPAASSSQPSNTHTTQTHSAVIQSTPSLSQQPPSAAHNTVAVWRARFVRCLCCAPI